MRSAKPLTVSLGRMRDLVEERVASGRYESASEVIRAGLRALEREEAAMNELMAAKVREALSDGRPSLPMDDVFERLEERHRILTGQHDK